MTNLDAIKELVNSENAVENIVDFFLEDLHVDMEIFDHYTCTHCSYNEKPECPSPCPYSDREEIKMWLMAEEE